MKLNHPRIVLVLIFLLFATPVFLAVMMHSSWWHYQPSEMTNRGILVQPPQAIDYTRLTFDDDVQPPADQWVIVYPVASPCMDTCRSDLESLRQIHKATGRRQQQLVVLPLLPAGAEPGLDRSLLGIYADFHPGQDRDGEVVAALARIADVDPQGGMKNGQAFLVDPSGNIMMRYAPGFDPGDLNKDLKRLLKWSAKDG
jgi:hypothetical protein